jgi:Myb/SANT-like DNA-binding protein
MSNTRSRDGQINWSSTQVDELLDFLLDAKSQGLTSDNGFKSTVWVDISQRISGPSRNPRQCQSKWSMIKKEFKDVKWLQDLSGMGWDEEAQICQAEKEVWDQLLEVNLTLFYPFYYINLFRNILSSKNGNQNHFYDITILNYFKVML